MTTEGKNWWESKTIWIGILQIACSIGFSLADFLNAGDFTGAAIALFITGIVSIVLRFLTNEPLNPVL